MRNRSRLAIIAAGLAICAGCAGPDEQDDAAPPRPNIVLISLDTVRSDYIGCYAEGVAATPAIDRIAREGVRYRRAISSSPWTLPAHASLFSGRPVSGHGARYDPDAEFGVSWHRVSVMSDEVPTMAELLTAAGYHSAGVASVVWLKPEFGLARGFVEYAADADDAAGVPADRVTDRAIELIRGRPTDRPLFLFVHYFDAHSPYAPPAPHRPAGALDEEGSVTEVEMRVNAGGGEIRPEEREKLERMYEGEIEFIDAQIARIWGELEAAGIYDETWIIVTADHGESFGDHDFYGHGLVTWDDVLSVPLVMKLPDRLSDRARAGTVVETTVQPAELLATLLGALRLDIPPGAVGRNLLPRGSDRLGRREQPVVAEAYRNLSMIRRFGARWNRDERALYLGGEKLVRRSDGTVALYDLDADPRELENLAGRRLERVDEMQALLDSWLKSASAAGFAGAPAGISEENLQEIRALGYLD